MKGKAWTLFGEDLLQANICSYLDSVKIVYYSIPNGGKRSKFLGWLMKQTGLKAGVPDLHIPCSFSLFTGELRLSLYLELKVKNNNPRKSQREWHEKLRALGHEVRVIKTVEELIKVLKECYPEKMLKVRF